MAEAALFVVCGLDYAGKDKTLAALQGYLLDVDVYTQGIVPKNELKTEADLLAERRGDAYALYLKAAQYEINNFKPPHVPTIASRLTAVDSAVYYGAKGEADRASSFEEQLQNYPVPAISVVLTAPIEIIRQRYEDREGQRDTNDQLIADDPLRYQRAAEMLVYVMQKYFGARVIDTSTKNPDGVAREILSIS